MLAYPLKEDIAMERDMDLVRELLIKIAANPGMDGRTSFVYQTPEEIGIPDHSIEELAYHVKLLIDNGYLKGNPHSGYTMPSISRMTMDGHDFIDSIRDSGIWSKTKERLSGLPGITLRVIAEIATAELRKKLGLL